MLGCSVPPFPPTAAEHGSALHERLHAFDRPDPERHRRLRFDRRHPRRRVLDRLARTGAVETLLHLRAGPAAVLPHSRHLQHHRPDRRPEHQALQPHRTRHPAAGGADPADPGGGHQGHPAVGPEAGADVPGRFGQHHARRGGGLPGDARDPSRYRGRRHLGRHGRTGRQLDRWRREHAGDARSLRRQRDHLRPVRRGRCRRGLRVDGRADLPGRACGEDRCAQWRRYLGDR